MAEAASLLGVSKTYAGGVAALRDLSLDLREGEPLAILGPNGAGKTTAIKILSGLLRPDAGRVRVKGEDFFPGSRLSRIFGIALQEIGLWPYLTVDETLTFVGGLYGMKSGRLHSNKSEIAAGLDLEKWRTRRVETLSDGLKRRLNLACALLHAPEILILDEPSLGLDPRARRAFWEYLERFVMQKGVTLLLSTHDMEEADRFSRRVGILHKGRLVALDSAESLKAAHGVGDMMTFELAPAGAYTPELFSGFPGFRRVSARDGEVELLVLNGIPRLPALLSHLGRAGVEVNNLKIKPNTLESVFLNLTGSALD